MSSHRESPCWVTRSPHSFAFLTQIELHPPPSVLKRYAILTQTHWGSEGCAAGSVATDLQSDSRGSMYHLKRISLHLSNITWDFIDSLKSSLLRSRLICSPLLSKTPNKHQSFFFFCRSSSSCGIGFQTQEGTGRSPEHSVEKPSQSCCIAPWSK